MILFCFLKPYCHKESINSNSLSFRKHFELKILANSLNVNLLLCEIISSGKPSEYTIEMSLIEGREAPARSQFWIICHNEGGLSPEPLYEIYGD